jgi:hypothetical protein
MTRKTVTKPRAPARAAKPKAPVKAAPRASRRKAAPLPAHREAHTCLVIPSNPAEHAGFFIGAPIVAQSSAPVPEPKVIDRPAAIVALANLMDQRRTINGASPSERFMLDHGVPLDDIIRLREEEARICAEIEGSRAAPIGDDGPARPRVNKTAGFKWLIDTATNPNREGSQRWDGFALLRDCADLGEFYQKGGKPDFIRWALHKKWIEVQG